MKKPAAPPGSITDLQRKIHEIRRVDTSKVELPYLVSKYSALLHGATAHKYWGPALGEVWRGQIGYHSDVSRMSYPPKPQVDNFGRANPPNFSVFYGSCGSNARLACIEELRAEPGETVTMLKWQLHQPTEPFVILGLGGVHEFFAGKPGAEKVEELFRRSQQQVRDRCGSDYGFRKNNLVLDFLDEIFLEKVEAGFEHRYVHGVAIVHCFIQGFACLGILYRSVASGCRSLNVALAPRVIDKRYYPVEGRVVEVVAKRPDGIEYKLIAETTQFQEDGAIVWSQ